jgi:hypothetical protein
MPGVKGSTLTGDYRGGSFASERAADNEVWPEAEVVQDWFAEQYFQPIYEEVITQGILIGYFAGVVTPEEFAARKDSFLACAWQGPVARSINPVDDATAASLRKQTLISSPQIEAQKEGRISLDLLRDVYQYIEDVKSMHFDPQHEGQLIQQALGAGVGVGGAPGGGKPVIAKGGAGKDGEGEPDKEGDAATAARGLRQQMPR